MEKPAVTNVPLIGYVINAAVPRLFAKTPVLKEHLH